MGNQQMNVRRYTTNRAFYYLVFFRVEINKMKHCGNIKVVVKANGVYEARDKAKIIANDYCNSHYADKGDVKAVMLRWVRYDHKPKKYDCVVTNPVVRVK